MKAKTIMAHLVHNPDALVSIITSAGVKYSIEGVKEIKTPTGPRFEIKVKARGKK